MVYQRPLNQQPALEDAIEDPQGADSLGVGQQEQLEQPEQGGRNPGWEWVGSPSRPEAQSSSDGISDLLEVDTDAEEADVDDLVDVDYDRDILDSGEDGTLDDLVNVSQDDIIGRPPPIRRRLNQPPNRARRYTDAPPSVRGVRY